MAAVSQAAEPRKEKAPAGMIEVDGRYFPDFAPLPPVPYPTDNPPGRKKERLGAALFADKRLSNDGAMSCATCHDPAQNFTDGFPTARGRGGKRLPRRTRSLKNAAYNSSFFWDGRAPTLEQQFFMVLRNHDEMNMDPTDLVARLREIPAYRKGFGDAFGAEGISTRTISRAVAAYERTLRVCDTIFDQFLRGDARNMIESPTGASDERAGMGLFKGKARCIVCHNGPTLSDGKFHNTGFCAAPVDQEDPGLEGVDGRAESRGKFRTPMLRNSARTAPYLHDGSVDAIESLLEIYNEGGRCKERLDPDIRPLELTREEILQLKSFLYRLLAEFCEKGAAR